MKHLQLAALGACVALSAHASTEPPVPSQASDVRPLLIGAAAPRVTLHGLDGTPVELPALLAQQPTILVFYRGGW